VANEKRLRTNFLTGAIDTADLTSTSTTMNSAGLAAAPVVDTTNHLPIVFDPAGSSGTPEIAYITAHTAGATSATIVRGQEGSTARAVVQGTKWANGPTVRDFAPAGRFASFSKTGANYTINSTTWVDVDTTTDMVVTAQVGDWLELGLYGRAQGSSTHPYLVLDYHTMVSGSAVNSVVTGAAPGTSPASSSAAWARGNTQASGDTPINQTFLAGAHLYQVQAGDLASGKVTVRLRAVSGASVTLYATDPALKGYVKNLGAQEA